MRLHFKLSPNKESVPFAYQHFLLGTFHKWMEKNNVHNGISLYSLGWLHGGSSKGKNLEFSNGASWFISYWNENIGKKIIQGAMNDPAVCCGMYVEEILIQEEPDFNSQVYFNVSSPVFIRKYDSDKKAEHLTFDNIEADHYMTETMKRKLQTANLDLPIKIRFDRNYEKAQTKLVNIKGIQSKASLCPVIIEGDPQAIKFAWNVGIGHCTGSGFGSLY